MTVDLLLGVIGSLSSRLGHWMECWSGWTVITRWRNLNWSSTGVVDSPVQGLEVILNFLSRRNYDFQSSKWPTAPFDQEERRKNLPPVAMRWMDNDRSFYTYKMNVFIVVLLLSFLGISSSWSVLIYLHVFSTFEWNAALSRWIIWLARSGLTSGANEEAMEELKSYQVIRLSFPFSTWLSKVIICSEKEALGSLETWVCLTTH